MRRYTGNPILTREDIPPCRPDLVDVSSVFNPGAIHFQGRDRLLLRVQTRGRETVLMWADREEGREERWTVRPEVAAVRGLERLKTRTYHVYDPRLTVLDGTLFAVLAADTETQCRLLVARVNESWELELVSADESGDRRNGVLFPERVGGRYLRMERPNEQGRSGGPTSGSRIVLAESDDLATWLEVGPVMAGRWRYWDELIGSGPPPVKTRSGWLHIYHGVATHFAGVNIYQAGVVLLDLKEPACVLARSRLNILEPREMYELAGQVPNVVFTSGWIVEKIDAEGFALPDSPVRVYYGAADTCVAMGTTTVNELLNPCEPVR